MNQSLAAKIGWVFAILLGIASVVIMQMRLAPLPELNVELGPNLEVRGTKVLQNDEADSSAATIQRGDQLLSLGGQRVKDLRDARIAAIGIQKQLALSKLGDEAKDVPKEEGLGSLMKGEGGAVDGADSSVNSLKSLSAPTIAPLSYQLLRPRHLFLVSLKDNAGVTKDISSLMRPEDTLLEIDGRRLPNPVGIEAARSVVNSRPDAVLTIEHHDALFSGNLYTSLNLLQYSHIAAFILVLAVFLLLFGIGRKSDNLAAASMTAVETVFFVWIALLGYRYMWVIADPIIRAGVIVSLIFFRPVSAIAVVFSHSRSSLISYPRRTGSLWVSLIAAFLASVALLVMNASDNPESWELAPQVAGLVLLLFLLYEVVSGFTARARSPIVDRSGYVAGIIGLTCLGAIFAYFSSPNAFLEGRWCLFAMILVGLIWSADLVYVLTGSSGDQMAVVESQSGRATLILDYLASLSELSYSTAFALVVWRPTGAIILRAEHDKVVVQETTKSLRDAIAILIQEQAIIPNVSNLDPHEDPMAGIATTMGLSLAFTMAPPDRAVVVDGAELVAVGFDSRKDPADSLPLPIEVLQTVQDLMTPEVWLSSFLEALTYDDSATSTRDSGDSQVEIDRLTEELKRVKRGESKSKKRVHVLESQRDLFVKQLDDLNPRDFEFEPDLIDGFDYLLAQPGPIVISGDFYSGKRLTANAAALRDPIYDGKKRLVIDASKTSVDELGEESFADYIANGTLILHNAQMLTPHDLKRCVTLAHDHHRLYLLFVDATLGHESVLQSYTAMIPDFFEPLMERELVLPELWRRKVFLQSVINVFLFEATQLLNKDVSGFSDPALAYLQRLPWRGGLAELRMIIFYCVAHTREMIIDDEVILRFWDEVM